MKSFHLQVLAAERVFYDGPCQSLTVPTIDGMYGVMAHHENVVIAIVPGIMTLHTDTGEEQIAAVSEGLLKVESDEALLFAQQTGASANLTAGARFRALVYGGDKEALAFQKVTEAVGLCVDCKQTRGVKRLACISTAFELYKKVGSGIYREAMQTIVDAWKGDPDSLRAETVQGMVEFVDLYHGEYSRKRLVMRLRQTDPVVIFREGRAMTSLPGYKRYLYQVYRIYNGSSAKTALPMKF